LQLADVWQQARSAVGLLTVAQYLRFRQGLPLLVLFSCDNLTDNGHKLKAAIRRFAAHCQLFANEPAFLLALTELVCPCSMVDSITPATDDALRQLVATELGVSDAWPVKREAFCQWVIEDVLPPSLQQLRHYWQQAGVIFTPDVSAFEAAKLRLLNAPHSMMAYLGCLLGIETVFDAMQQPAVVELLQTLVRREILPQVPAVAGLDLAAYSAAIFQRFRNPQVRHLLAQIAWDGSQKLPMRLLPALQQNLKQQPVQLLALAIACWLQFLRLRHSQAARAAGQVGQPPLVDPLAPLLLATAAQCSGNASTDVALWLALDQVFAAELAGQPAFVSALQQAYQLLAPLVPLTGAAACEAIDIGARNQQVLQQLLAQIAGLTSELQTD
jgi:fructuronate reductase